MTPPEYFDEFVEGNARDYREDTGSVRRAFNAAVSASHMADHTHEYSARHVGELALRFPDFTYSI